MAAAATTTTTAAAAATTTTTAEHAGCEYMDTWQFASAKSKRFWPAGSVSAGGS